MKRSILKISMADPLPLLLALILIAYFSSCSKPNLVPSGPARSILRNLTRWRMAVLRLKKLDFCCLFCRSGEIKHKNNPEGRQEIGSQEIGRHRTYII
jgi:hypothetical protein